jgi:purine-binding chemotaxis protein CheW
MATQDAFEYVTVMIGEQMFGVPVHEIREVFSPQGVTGVPRAPEEVAGLLNLRGRIVTAIDARQVMGLPPREDGAACMALGVERGSELYGVLVDRVGEVMRLDESTLESVPGHLDARWRGLLRGVHRLDGRLLAVMDIFRLVAAQPSLAA